MPRDFAHVYDEEIWTVYGFFAYRVRNRSDAEDLTQRAFERALRAWKRYDPQKAPVRVWLLAIARNLLIDHYRAEDPDREQPLEETAEEQLGSVVAEPDLGIEADLAEALAVLSERDREVVALRFGGDLKGPEIAELTGLSVANVQQILSRSLRRMRAELDQDQPDEAAHERN